MNITIIYLDDDMLISKKKYEVWREIQDEYENYKASLGPWSGEEIIEYLGEEYPDLNPVAEIQVSNLLNASNQTAKVTFND